MVVLSICMEQKYVLALNLSSSWGMLVHFWWLALYHLCHTCQPHPYHHTDHQTVLFSSTRRSRQKSHWVYLLFHSCRCLWHVDLHLQLPWGDRAADRMLKSKIKLHMGSPLREQKDSSGPSGLFPQGDSTILLFVCMTVWFICGQRPLCNDASSYSVLIHTTSGHNDKFQDSGQSSAMCLSLKVSVH